MIRNLKVPGLALVALLAMSALASTASAQFESEAESTNLTVSTNAMQKYAPAEGGVAVECTTIKVTGTLTGKANTLLRVTPTYSNCETFLGASTAVNTNGCEYWLHSSKGSTNAVTAEIVCPGTDVIGPALVETASAKFIEITVGSICKYTIRSQFVSTSAASFKNIGTMTTGEVIVEPNVKGIKSTLVTNDFFCPGGGSTGTYTGNSTITGENAEGKHVGIFVD
jgi:hypothetical protein